MHLDADFNEYGPFEKIAKPEVSHGGAVIGGIVHQADFAPGMWHLRIAGCQSGESANGAQNDEGEHAHEGAFGRETECCRKTRSHMIFFDNFRPNLSFSKL